MSIPPLLTIAELRAQCRVEDSADDATLLAMAAAAERHVESITGQVLTPRTQVQRKAGWPPAAGWELLRTPVQAVTSVGYTDRAGAAQTVPPSVWVLRTADRPVLALRQDAVWPEIQPDSEILITLQTGYATGACPPALKQACLLLAGFWFDNRSAVNVGNIVQQLPLAFAELVADFKLKRIG